MTTILLLLLLSCAVHASGQDVAKSYVQSETFLCSDGTRSVRTVQYVDGLGRPTQLCTNGLGQQGNYVYTRTEYDRLGRDSLVWLPVAGSTSADFLTDIPNRSYAQYADGHAYSTTDYDELDRLLQTTTAGEAWHSAGRAKTISYVTNHGDDIKHYTTPDLTSDDFTENGCYAANTLTGETDTDEDNHAVTIYKDRRGNVVLERRNSGNSQSHADHGWSDTYYVYSDEGLLRFVLTPEYQLTGSKEAVYTYKYDTMNRCTEKTIPGCAPVTYAYDHGDRAVIMQDGLLREKNRYRFMLYDMHGRLAVQGTCTGYTLDGNRNAIVRFNAATQGIGNTGYVLTDAQSLSLSDIKVETANYYDRHTFLTHGSFTSGSAASELASSAFPPQGTATNAIGYKTGERTATTDGHTLYAAYYYDPKGQCIDERHTTLSGGVRKIFTTYSFTGKPLTVTEVFPRSSSTTYTITTQYAYDPHNDQPTTTTVTVDDGGTPHVVSQLCYNDLGQVVTETRPDIGDDVGYEYDLHGWLKKTEGKFFTEQLNYATGPGTPRFNGDISSQLWMAADSVWRGYKFTYHQKGMMQNAVYGEGSTLTANTSRYNETISAFTPNGAIAQLMRRGRTNAGTYGYIDNLTYSYDGVRLANVNDAVLKPLSYTGAFEYRDTHHDAATPDFTYNTAGLLTADLDKGITEITYNNIGLVDSIRYTDGNVIRYVYSLTGEKLRVTHNMELQQVVPEPTIPVSAAGETISINDDTALQNASAIYDDTFYYGPNFTVSGVEPTATYYFGGGYIKIPTLATTTVPTPQYYYYSRDHLGNVRSVAKRDNTTNVVTEVQRTHYYPFGGIIADISTGRSVQNRLYNGKELDQTNALYWYDYGARQYDATRGQFTGPDPLAEKYYPWNPWTYCLNNPIRYTDLDGKFPTKAVSTVAKVSWKSYKLFRKYKKVSPALLKQAGYAELEGLFYDGEIILASDASVLNRLMAVSDIIIGTDLNNIRNAEKEETQKATKRTGNSKNEKHGDGGRAKNSAEKHIQELREQSKNAPKKKKMN